LHSAVSNAGRTSLHLQCTILTDQIKPWEHHNLRAEPSAVAWSYMEYISETKLFEYRAVHYVSHKFRQHLLSCNVRDSLRQLFLTYCCCAT
jgi:hypothetical protein